MDVKDVGDPWCTACERAGGMGALYVVKIDKGPRIGTRIHFAHVQSNPSCGRRRVTAVLDRSIQ